MKDLDRAASAANPTQDPSWAQTALLTGQLAREIGTPLASALERVIALTNTGKIRRAGLVSLRQEIEQAMQAGEAAQQLCSLLQQNVRLRRQPVDLNRLMEATLAPALGSAADPGVQFRGTATAAVVQADALMLERLVSALAAWALRRTEGPVHWAVEHGKLNTEARMSCALRLRHPAAEFRDGLPTATIDWRLVETLASVLELKLVCRLDGPTVTVGLEFPRTQVQQSIEGMVVEELDPEDALALYAGNVAGASVLIVAGRRETRELAQAAVKPLGLISDFARSVEEARTFCKNGLPHAIVYEPTVRGTSFEPLRVELLAETASLVMVEIFDEDSTRLENAAASAAPRTRVRREKLEQDLPPLLMNELSRVLPSNPLMA